MRLQVRFSASLHASHWVVGVWVTRRCLGIVVADESLQSIDERTFHFAPLPMVVLTASFPLKPTPVADGAKVIGLNLTPPATPGGRFPTPSMN